MDPTPPPDPHAWLGLAAAFAAGVLAWIVPIAATGAGLYYAIGKPELGERELITVAGVAAVVTFAVPLAVMAWQRWYPGAMAFAAGMGVGAMPVFAFVAWIVIYIGGRP